VPGKNSPGGLALDLLHYSALLGLTRHETDRPAGVPVGRRAADHRDNRALLRVVQHPVGHRAGLVSEGRFQSPLEVSPPDPAHLARICADSAPGVDERPTAVEELENADASPVALTKRPEALQLVEVVAVSDGQLQPRKVRSPHPWL